MRVQPIAKSNMYSFPEGNGGQLNVAEFNNWLKETGTSIKEAAKLIGVSYSAVQRYTRGQNLPTKGVRLRIERVVGAVWWAKIKSRN